MTAHRDFPVSLDTVESVHTDRMLTVARFRGMAPMPQPVQMCSETGGNRQGGAVRLMAR